MQGLHWAIRKGSREESFCCCLYATVYVTSICWLDVVLEVTPHIWGVLIIFYYDVCRKECVGTTWVSEYMVLWDGTYGDTQTTKEKRAPRPRVRDRPIACSRRSLAATTILKTTMMSSNTLRALSFIASRSSRTARQSTSCNVSITRVMFSAQPAAHEKPLTPGVGLGKTSTGLVSNINSCRYLLLCLSAFISLRCVIHNIWKVGYVV